MKKCLCCMQDYSEQEGACPFCGYSESQMEKDRQSMPEALPMGTILGNRFLIGRVMSLTGYAILYLSWDMLLHRRLVLREYFPTTLANRAEEDLTLCCPDEESRKKFEEGKAVFLLEGKILSENQDLPEICNIYRCIEENGTAYQVMEYMQIETLQERLEHINTAETEIAQDLFLKLCDALEVVQKRGIVHGNLNPDNIGFDEFRFIRFFGFGVAEREMTLLTKGEIRTDRPAYTAPEYDKEQPLTSAADMYSLGAIYYRLLSGKEFTPSLSEDDELGLENTEPSRISLLKALLRQDPGERIQDVEQITLLFGEQTVAVP